MRGREKLREREIEQIVIRGFKGNEWVFAQKLKKSNPEREAGR